MSGYRLTGFAGVVPRLGKRLLKDNQAQVAVNCRLTSGYLVPLRPPKLVYSAVPTAIQTIYRMTDGLVDYWLTWTRDVDAVKGPIAGDTTYRTYFTGDGEPRVTNLALASGGAPYPQSFYVLGVYPPETVPSLTHAGGAGAAVSRAFVYTFVTQWGEESQPSPPTAVVAGKVDGTWTIGAGPAMDVAPLNSTAITGSSWAAGIATITVASTFGYRVGEEINVTGMNPAGYNASKAVILTKTATQLTYALAVNPGAFVAGGTLARVAPHNTTSMTKRLYWTETLADGTHYRLVKEIAVATTNDTVAGNTVSTAELTSTDWVMPPVDLKGIRFMANGIAVGFRSNTQVCFSPAYIPYAFPNAYRQVTDFDIVGLEVVGNMVVVGTKGTPYYAAGVDPAGMVLTKVDNPWPCLAKRSMVNMGAGVEYAAPQGKVLIGPGGAQLTTHELYTQEEWKALNPETFKAAQYAGRYVTCLTLAGLQRVLIIDRAEFAAVIEGNSDIDFFYGDQTTGRLYALIDDDVYEWDADAGQKMMFDWISKEFVFPKPTNLGAAKLDVDFAMSAAEVAAAQAAYAAALALNQAIITAGTSKGSVNSHSLNGRALNGSALGLLPPLSWDSLTFTLYIDGVAKFSKTVTNNDPFRMPSGYTADNAAFQVTGNVTVKAIVCGTTMKDLELA